MRYLLLLFFLLLVGCGVEDSPPEGVLRYAIGASSGLRGQFDALYSMDVNDGFVGGLIHEPLLATDDTLHYTNEGSIASMSYDRAANTITLRLDRDVYWHDGTPLSLDDLVFAYEVIAHPDYDGIRLSDQVLNVVGVREYNQGLLEKISGLRLEEDGRELTIYLHKLLPTTLMGGGFWATPAPRHWLGGIPVSELGRHPRVRHETIGVGPFHVESAVVGEAIRLRAFGEYWQGRPLLDGIDIEVMNPELLPMAMKRERFDVAPISPQQLGRPVPKGYTYVPNKDSSGVFGYLGFRLGSGGSYRDRRHIHNPALRRAIAHAIDYNAIGAALYNGTRRPATTIVPPLHIALQDESLEGFAYDPDLARRILDEAGFVDTDGDGLREAPDGGPLTIRWATTSGEGTDVYVAYKLQSLEDIGLDVRLYQGRTHEFNTYYSLLSGEADIDMFDAAWSVGYDPNPSRLWGPSSPLNYTRYSSESFSKILSSLEQEDMWHESTRKKAYNAWQQAFYNEIPAIPTLWRQDYTAVHQRVQNYDPQAVEWHRIALGRRLPPTEKTCGI